MKKILIVDDEKKIRKIIVDTLKKEKKEKYEVLELENGFNIEQTLFKFTPDLIILDLMMPEVDGFTLLRNTQKFYNDSQQPPPKILLLSAFLNEDSVKRLEGLNFSDFINKPFHIALLKDKITNLLKDKA